MSSESARASTELTSVSDDEKKNTQKIQIHNQKSIPHNHGLNLSTKSHTLHNNRAIASRSKRALGIYR